MTNLRLALIAATVLVAMPLPALAATPSHQFGPDSTSTGVFTGQGTTPLGVACDQPPAPTPLTCTGFLASFDRTELDVTVRVPHSGGLHPLLVFLHGWGASKNSGPAEGVPDDAAITGAGFTYLRYSARGFGESWGQANLDDVNVELEDLRSLIGQVVDDPRFKVNPDSVGVFGVSYGGGASWLAAARPRFTSPAGKAVRIRTVAPIIPWTDLLYSLLPNGRPNEAWAVAGSGKLSFSEGLFLVGKKRPADRPYDNYPRYLETWQADLLAREPCLCDPVFVQLLNGLDGYRSIYWQPAFWSGLTSNRLPVFELQGFTDDLFPLPEARRMYDALKAVDASYPIALYLGDIGHQRGANKPGEVAYTQQRLLSWFRFYLQGQGPAPPLNVTAAITRPAGTPFSTADLVFVPTLAALSTSTRSASFPGPATLTWNPANAGGLQSDPIFGEGLSPGSAPPLADEVPGDVVAYSMPGGFTVAGQPVVTLTASTQASREELNVRLFDVAPDAGRQLLTRGTFTLDTGDPLRPLGTVNVSLTAYGNLWVLPAGHTLLLEISNVDTPYIAASRVPSVTTISQVTLEVPVRG